MKLIFSIFSAIHVTLYRLTGGKMGGHVNGGDVLLLTTTGRKSGKTRVSPVMYMEQDGNYIVSASAAGAPKSPGWYWNATKGDAPVTVQVNDKVMTVDVVDTQGEERDHLYALFKDAMSSFADYEKKTDRTIPVLKLIPQS